MRHQNKLSAGLGVVTASLLATGVAYAAWTSSGEGVGSAKSIKDEVSAIAAGDFAADLYPGADETITVTVHNPNPYPVIVTQISAGSSAAIASSSCAAGTVTTDLVGDETPDAASVAVLQSDGTSTTIEPNETGEFELDTHMAPNAHNDCKLKTFTLGLTAALRSDAS